MVHERMATAPDDNADDKIQTRQQIAEYLEVG